MLSFQPSTLPISTSQIYKPSQPRQLLPQIERSSNIQVSSDSHPLNWIAKARACYANNAALKAHSQGKMAQAEKGYHTALALYKKAYGENHPYSASVLYNLADLYHAEQRYPEAEQYYWQAYRLEKANYGDTHPRTIQTMQNLAALYHDTNRPNEAKVKYLQIVEAQNRALPQDNSAIATTHGDLAALLHEQGDYENAKNQYNQAISLFQQLANSAEIERIQQNLAQLEEQHRSHLKKAGDK